MNPQGTPEHTPQGGEQLPTPNPVRTETLADLDTARDLIHSTGCSPEEYNSCTEDFEAQREQCRDECMASRRELLGEVELQNKDISELTIDEAKQLLILSQTEYQSYEGQSNVGKGLSLLRNFAEQKTSYANIGARKEMNEFQEALIKKIFGEDTLSQGFNEDSILGYNNTIGNHIIDLSSFENDLKQKAPNDWNSQALVNYLGKLLAMGPINITTIIHIFGASQLVRLQHEWTKETAGPAKQKLQEIPGISWLIDGINSIDYSSLLQNPDGFREVALIFDELSNEEKESIIENATDYFIENPELIEQINLTGNNEGVFDTSIMKARNIILAKEYSASLAAEYIGGPDVADILEAIMVVGAEGNGQGFDFSGINEIIEDYNKENDTNYSLIDSSKQAHILKTIQSLSEASMLSENYGTKIQQLRSLQDTLRSLYSQRTDLFARLKSARNMQESEAEESLLSDIGDLDREIFSTRGDIGRIQEQVEDIEEAVDDIQNYIDTIKGSLSELRFDFSTSESVSKFDENPNLVGLIGNADDLVQYLEKTEKSIPISQVHKTLRSNFEVLRSIRNIGLKDINLVPQEYFEINSANQAHSKIFVLLNNAGWGTEKLILTKFESFNPNASEEIGEALYHIVTDSGLHENKKNKIRDFLENSSISSTLSEEQKSKLQLSHQNTEINETSERERFEARFRNMRIHNNTPQEGDEEVFQSYLDRYGYLDVKNQFKSLLQNKKINFNTIQGIVPFIQFNATEFPSEIQIGIENRGIPFIKLLRQEYRSHPYIITQGLGKCRDNLYEKKDFLNHMIINSPQSLLAVYDGLNRNINEIKEIFWNELKPSEIEQMLGQINSEGEDEESQKVTMILNEIQKRQEQEKIVKEGLQQISSTTQEAYENGDINLDSFILDIQALIQNNDEISEDGKGELEKILIEIIQLDQSTEKDRIYVNVYDILAREFHGDPEKIQTFMGSLLAIELEKNEATQEEEQENIGRNISIFPTKFQEEVYANIPEGMDLNGYIALIYKKYISENIESFRENPYNAKNTYIQNFLNQYGFLENSISEEQRNSMKGLLTSITDKEFIQYKIDHPEEFTRALQNGGAGLGDFVGQMGNNLGNQAIKDIENYDNIPSINNNSGGKSESVNSGNGQPNTTPSGREIKYDGENITITNGNTEIPISSEELQIIQNNPEAEQNLIQTNEAFKKSGLPKLWDIRQSIFRSIANVRGFGFQVNEDYINKNELKIVFDSILISVEEEPLKNSAYSVDEIVSEMERRNGTTSSGDEVQVNHRGETKIEEKFLLRYFPPGATLFEYGKFEKALKNNEE